MKQDFESSFRDGSNELYIDYFGVTRNLMVLAGNTFLPKKLKISQIQFQAMSTPQDNAILLEKLFKKTNKFKPNLICTPECSNIITFDKKYLFSNINYQNDCPIIKISKKFALENKVIIHLGSLLLKIKGKKKLANRSILIVKRLCLLAPKIRWKNVLTSKLEFLGHFFLEDICQGFD